MIHDVTLIGCGHYDEYDRVILLNEVMTNYVTSYVK